MEPQYESTAVLRLASPLIATPELGSSYMAREMEAMVSDSVLQPVVERLRLADEWSVTAEQAVLSLRERTEVTSLGNEEEVSRVALTVRAPNAELTREIAAELAFEYQQQGNLRAQEDAERFLKALNEKIAEQEKRVEEKRRALDSLEKATGRRMWEARDGGSIRG
ncbi:hypothetical protein AAFN60_10930 [Roseibacillus persicicus]|nr:hypothetical protein [Roseibacillus persicicus]